jgi:hypothetical protein
MHSSQVHFVFSAQPFALLEVDQAFANEARAFANAGFTISKISIEDLEQGLARIKPTLPSHKTIIYRGWMLTREQYQKLSHAAETADSTMLTTPEDYLASHHLPNWYPKIAEFTPETRFFAAYADLELELSRLNWSGYFVKDFVKSLKTSRGSILRSPEEIKELVSQMVHFRGTVEGGIVVRRLENLQPHSERRFFVLGGQPYTAADAPIPQIVFEVAKRLAQPFYSVDIAVNIENQPRVVEIGDGQVSDLVGWKPGQFVKIWQR